MDLIAATSRLIVTGLAYAIMVGFSHAAAGSGVDEIVRDSGFSAFPQAIQTIFRERCIQCHNASAEGGLTLTSPDSLLQRNDSGLAAIVPGRSTLSSLILRITSQDPQHRMPPEGEPLTSEQVKSLSQWIDDLEFWETQPASQRTHWAYRSPQRPTTADLVRNSFTDPEVTNRILSPIDVFIQARLQKESPPILPADREEPGRLLRRVCLDLTGLPPSTDAVERFVSDPTAAAYESIIDSLLASPAYGERWAQQWLDMARFADSNGYQADQFRSLWPYRDWVIDAFNQDMPFDQFTIEQLAGDLLPGARPDQIIATGFHRCTTCNVEAGVDPEENRTNQVADRVHTTATVWLGTTLECARCHDHKYDPFSQQDYYQLYAFFNNTPLEVSPPEGEGVQYNIAGPELAVASTDHQQIKLTELEKRLTAARKLKAELSASGPANPQPETVASQGPAGISRTNASPEAVVSPAAVDRIIAELEQMQHQIRPAVSGIMTELNEPRQTFILRRGDFLNPGAQVSAATPAALTPKNVNLPEGRRNRLDLARWLVSPENSLTARVTVNRWWAEFFGRGIVETTEDFGSRSARPTHPELLDWLAVEFMENGWSMKRLHKSIVMSACYQQSSRISLELLERDPHNRLFARGPRFRMSSEMIRDNALAISGLLSARRGGPSVYPPQPDHLWRHVGRNAPVFVADTDEDRFRRGIYVVWRRSAPFPAFTNFDAPDRTTCVVRRSRTNTPLQALTLLNDTAYFEMAQALAARIVQERLTDSTEERIRFAFRLCTARLPSDAERQHLTDMWEIEAKRYLSEPDVADKVTFQTNIAGLKAQESDLPRHELAAWISVATVLLNLDETITKN